MNLPYADLQELVTEMRDRHFPGLHVLPYNRFDLGRSQDWWLSPTSDKAAHRFGKALFTIDPEMAGEGHVFCGFNVEKGVLARDAGRPNQVLNGTWFWHQFLKLANEPLATAVAAAESAIGACISIDVGFGPLIPAAQWDRVCFYVSEGRFSEVLYHDAAGLLAEIRTSRNVTEFADALRKLDGAKTAWHWGGVSIGKAFTRDPAGPDDLDQCAAMLTHFQGWMR